MSMDAMEGISVSANGSTVDYDTDVLGGSWPGFTVDPLTSRLVAWGGNRSITQTNFTVVTINGTTGDELTRCTMSKSFSASFVVSVHLLSSGSPAVALLMDESQSPQVYTMALFDPATCAVKKQADVSAFAMMSGSFASLDSRAGVLYWMASTALGAGGLVAANVTSGKVAFVKTSGAALPSPGGDQGPTFWPMLDPVDNVLYIHVRGLILNELYRVDLAPLTAGGRHVGDPGAPACPAADLWYKLLASNSHGVFGGGLDYKRAAGSAQGPWLVFLSPYERDSSSTYPATLGATDMASCGRAPAWTNRAFNISQDCSGAVCNDGSYAYDPFMGAATAAAADAPPSPFPAAHAPFDPASCLVPMPTGSLVGIDMDIWDNSDSFRVYDAATGSLTGSVAAPDIQTFAGAVSNPLTAVDDERKWFMYHAASTGWQDPGHLYVFSFSDPTAPDMVHNVTYKNVTVLDMILWDEAKKELWAWGATPAGSSWGVVDLGSGHYAPRVKASSISNSNMASCMDASGSRRVIWQASWATRSELPPFSVEVHAVYMDSGDIHSYLVSGLEYDASSDYSTLYVRHDAAHDALVLIVGAEDSTSFGTVAVADLKASPGSTPVTLSPNSPLTQVTPGAVTYAQEGSLLNLLLYSNKDSSMGYRSYALEVFGDRVNTYRAASAGMPTGTLYSTFTPGV